MCENEDVERLCFSYYSNTLQIYEFPSKKYHSPVVINYKTILGITLYQIFIRNRPMLFRFTGDIYK